jgi:L,D-transpeptidase catalytic domain
MTGAQSLLAALVAAVAGAGTTPEGVVRPVLTPLPPRLAETARRTPLPEHRDVGARVVRRTALRDSPAGRIIARIGRRTEFGSARVMPVIRRRGRWLGVIATERPNGTLGWIDEADATLVSEPVRLHIDLSARTLRVREGDRTVLRMTVGIGGPQTPTPTGWFAVTDGIKGWGPYGCCILALSGHQPKLLQGWAGGDRLAVHGASGATAASASTLGCLRGGERDLRRLLKVARLGARVRIVA